MEKEVISQSAKNVFFDVRHLFPHRYMVVLSSCVYSPCICLGPYVDWRVMGRVDDDEEVGNIELRLFSSKPPGSGYHTEWFNSLIRRPTISSGGKWIVILISVCKRSKCACVFSSTQCCCNNNDTCNWRCWPLLWLPLKDGVGQKEMWWCCRLSPIATTCHHGWKYHECKRAIKKHYTSRNHQTWCWTE